MSETPSPTSAAVQTTVARGLLVDVCEIEQVRRLVDALEPTQHRASREELLAILRSFGDRAMVALAADRRIPPTKQLVASPTPSATTPTSRSSQ